MRITICDDERQMLLPIRQQVDEYLTLNMTRRKGSIALTMKKPEIKEELRNSTRPEDIQTCIKAGVLPKCYENTSIEAELQGQSALSCFTLSDVGTVTCPMGKILRKTKKKAATPYM